MPTLWDDLVDYMRNLKIGKITKAQKYLYDDVSDAGNKASKHRYNYVPGQERSTVRRLDHRCCFVTNKYSHFSKVAHILTGNTELVEPLRGLGVVAPDFKLADYSNLILMSPDLHCMWDKYATFVIVPSQAARVEMIDILKEDRKRAVLAAGNQETVYPCQLAYPKVITYDILFFQPSLLGSPGWFFSRADDHEAKPTHYIIPSESPDPLQRLEYLQKLGDDTLHREFLDIRHVTGRSERQAINPYLMVMNASEKLEYWKNRPLFTSNDPVYEAALQDCRRIIELITKPTGVNICMPSSGSSVGEAKSPGETNFNASMMKSWISCGGFDKTVSMESWRREVSELAVPGQESVVNPEEAPTFARTSRQICQKMWLL